MTVPVSQIIRYSFAQEELEEKWRGHAPDAEKSILARCHIESILKEESAHASHARDEIERTANARHWYLLALQRALFISYLLAHMRHSNVG